ncbi:MAG: hypothetical protein Q9166_001604 [cf. Caloplaca sp. 2 TL-2023]
MAHHRGLKVEEPAIGGLRRSGTNIRFFNSVSAEQKSSWDEEQGVKKESWNEQNVNAASDQNTLEDSNLKRFQILSTQRSFDDGGRDVVTLITKDGVQSQEEKTTAPNQRWIHIRSEAIAFKQFRNHLERLPGFDADYRQLANNVLDRVAKVCEKGFIHGRFLEPVTVLGQGSDPQDKSGRGIRRASFVCMPVFSIEPKRHFAYSKTFLGHPPRGLLQWRYRLESTADRDTKQVAAKSDTSGQQQLLYISYVWALIVGKRTILTCSPLDLDTVCGETLNIRSYPQALKDESYWCVQLIDTKKNMFYLPLASCQTFYELMYMIITRNLSQSRRMRSRLLDPRPKIKLVDDRQNPVSPSSWTATLKKFRGPLTRLLLVKSNEENGVSGDVEAGHCDNIDTHIRSDDESDSSESDTDSSRKGYSSFASDYSSRDGGRSDPISNAEHELQKLYKELRAAETQAEYETIYSLKFKIIPQLEARIIDLINEDFDAFMNVHKAKGRPEVDPSPIETPTGMFITGDDGLSYTLPERDDVSEDVYGNRQRYITPRLFRSRRTFEVDEGPSYIRGPNLKGIPYIEIDKARLYEHDKKRPSHHDEDIFVWEGHHRGRGRGGGKRFLTGETREGVYYMPSRKQVITSANTLGISGTSPTLLKPGVGPSGSQGVHKGFTTRDTSRQTARASRATAPTPQQTTIDKMSQELLQRRDEVLNPIFLWPTGIKLSLSAVLDSHGDSVTEQTPSTRFQGAESGSPVSARHQLLQAISPSDDFKLRLVLEEINDDLQTSKPRYSQNLAGKLLYKHAEERTIVEAKALLLGHEKIDADEVSNADLDEGINHASVVRRNKTRLFEAAKRLLGAFVPPDYSSGIMRKYWGAIYKLQQDEDAKPADERAEKGWEATGLLSSTTSRTDRV